jgi:glycosyltransferase involved in cell wall biosynthesis
MGAEGLCYEDGKDIVLADDASSFAEACIRLLLDDAARRTIAQNALARTQKEFSWEAVSREFERILENNRIPSDLFTLGV